MKHLTFYVVKTLTCLCNIQRFFSAVKLKISPEKKNRYFKLFAQNIDCGYKLQPPRDLGFGSKIKKKSNTPVNPNFTK